MVSRSRYGEEEEIWRKFGKICLMAPHSNFDAISAKLLLPLVIISQRNYHNVIINDEMAQTVNPALGRYYLNETTKVVKRVTLNVRCVGLKGEMM